MKAFTAVLVCFLVLAGCASANVVELKAANFDETIKSADLALVKFFAPWCGHCKKIAPEFKAAAAQLEGKAVLAEVNCDDEKDLCAKHGVRGYPTLFVFRKGEKSEDYSGGRTAKDIANYMIANAGPAVNFVASKEELEKVPMLDAKVIAVTASKTSDVAAAVEKVASGLRTSMSFAVVTDKDVAPELAMETVTVYRSDDESETFGASDKIDAESLKAFLMRARVPLLGPVGPDTIKMYSEFATSNVGWLFLDSKNRDANIAAAKEVARKYRNDLIMLWGDAELYSGLPNQLGVPKDAKFPAFVIDNDRKHFVQPADKPVNAETMAAFIDKYLKGEVVRSIKSEPVPSPETKDGMTTLVGSRLPALRAEGKDMMILFYAPWCGHCKKFHSTYDKVAKELEKEDIIIAKMDATANDIDAVDMKANGFPTIYLVKAANGGVVSYEGDRSFEDVMSFIKKNAKFAGAAEAAAPADDAADL